MQAFGPAAKLRAAQTPAPLADLLAGYPPTPPPFATNTVTTLQRNTARRANAGAQRRSVLGSYLATA